MWKMKSGEKIKNKIIIILIIREICWWLIYTYIIMLANMENCWDTVYV